MSELRAVIIGSWSEGVKAVEELLKRLGLKVAGCSNDPIEALNLIRSKRPDLVIMEGATPFLNTAEVVNKEHLAALVLFNNKSNKQVTAPVIRNTLLDCPKNPGDGEKWKVAITLLMEKFHKNREISTAREQINSMETPRQIVGRASQYLADNWGISVVQAFYFIQILSHNQGISLRQAAEKVIKIHQLTMETA